ncbi:hypothetical protein [Actinoplanes derwentensis]|nr:hypothetical protein [Actinoplanes derwentensis]
MREGRTAVGVAAPDVGGVERGETGPVAAGLPALSQPVAAE